jgi:hypothetical protein
MKLGFELNSDLGKKCENIHVKSSIWTGLAKSAFYAMSSNTPLNDFQGRWDQQGGQMIVGPGPYLHYFHSDKHGRDQLNINYLLEKIGATPLFNDSNGKIDNLV